MPPPGHGPSSGEARSTSQQQGTKVETAELLASRLRIETQTSDDLDEHRRPYLDDGFDTAMLRLFAEPAERVFGEESANEARARFAEAVNAALRAHHERSLGIVAHGTVIALYAAPYFHTGAAALWKRLQHPSFVVLDTDTGTGLRVVDEVE